MKLRIQGNSIRLRLSRSEVHALGSRGGLEEAVEFAPGQRLIYGLHASAEYEQIGVRFGGDRLIIQLPATEAEEWTENERAGLRGSVDLGGGRTLTLLVEKDYADLTEVEREEPKTEPWPEDDTLDRWDERSD